MTVVIFFCWWFLLLGKGGESGEVGEDFVWYGFGV